MSGIFQSIREVVQGATAAVLAQILAFKGAVDQAVLDVQAIAASLIGKTDPTLQEYGGVADGVTDASAALAAANATGRPLRINGVFRIAVATTITVPIMDTIKQIFTPDSLVVIDNGLPVRPEWFGNAAGNIRHAVDALPARGGVVTLRNATYPPSYNTATAAMFENGGGVPGVDYMIKEEVKFDGALLPKYAADHSRLEGGTIIKGPFYISSRAQGFQADKIGVDSGSAVCAELYGNSTIIDGFALLQTNKAAPVACKNVRIGEIRGLGSGPNSQCHAVLIEAVDGGTCEYAEGHWATHGVVLKVKNFTAGTLVGRGTSTESVILKSNDYAPLGGVTVANVICVSAVDNVNDPNFGLLVDGSAFPAGGVSVANAFCQNKAFGYAVRSGAWVMADVTVGSLITANCPTGMGYLGGSVRCHVGRATITGSVDAVYTDPATTDASNSIGSLNVTSALNAINCYGRIVVGDATFQAITGTALLYSTAAARIKIGKRSESGVATDWNLSCPLANGWVNHGGGEVFSFRAENGKINVNGLIKSGTAAGVVAGFSAQVAPPAAKRFTCSAVSGNGSVYGTVEVLITPQGEIFATPYANASTYLSLAGVSWDIPF